MARARWSSAGAVAHLAEVSRVHVRTVPSVALAVGAGLIVVSLLLVGYAKLLADVGYPALAGVMTTPEQTTLATVLLMVPITLLGLLAALVWAGLTVQVASAAVTGRRVALAPAALRALRRSPLAALLALLVFLGVVLAVVLAPIAVVTGLLGLALPAIRRGRTRTLLLLAVPFGLAAWLFVRTVLVLPSAWLAGGGVRSSFRDATERSRGREIALGVSALLAAAVTFAAGAGLAALTGPFGLGEIGAWIAQLLALLLMGPLVFAALAVLYHRGGAVSAPVNAPRRAAWRARTAVAVVVAMLAPLGIAGVAAPAVAAGPDAVSFTISAFSTTPKGTATTFNLVVQRAAPGEAPAPTGTLRVWIDGVEQTGPFELEFGGYDLVHTFTTLGEHTVAASYSGDDRYQAADADDFVITVTGSLDRVPTTVTDFTIMPGSPSASGAPLSAHVEVAANEGDDVPTGIVNVFLDGEGDPLASGPLVAGAVDLPFTLPPGTHHLYARYEPDDGFQASYLDLTHIVSTALSALVLASDDGSTPAGEAVRLTATMTSTPTATGSVSFAALPDSGSSIDLGSSSLVAGVATLDVSTLPVGAYRFVATYAGDGTVAGATSAPLAHTVTKGAVTVAVVSDVLAPVFGDTLDLTVTVDAAIPGVGTPTGSVRVLRDGVEVGTGVLVTGAAHIEVGVGGAGDHEYVAEYAGDAGFLSGEGRLDQTVAAVETSTLLVGDPVREHDYGDTQTYQGSVAADGARTIPTGTVQLWVGGYHVADAELDDLGRYEIVTDLVPVPATSPVSAWVVYVGDGNHAGSVLLPGDRVSVTMGKADERPVVSVSPVTPEVGGEVTLTATLPALGVGATGTVVFSTRDGDLVPEGETDPEVDVVDGVATLVTDVTRATTWITATYSGDGNFAASESLEFELTATAGAAVVTLAAADPFVYGEVVDLVATVSVPGGAPELAVEFRSGGTTLGAAVPVGGEATLPVCVGTAEVCPAGIPVLGLRPASLTARYPHSDVNAEGVSEPLAFAVVGAPTTITLEADNTDLRPGDRVSLRATVAAVDTELGQPVGSVVFYGMSGTDTRSYLGSGEIDENGEISLDDVLVGSGTNQLPSTARSIRAEFTPSADPATEVKLFAGSADEVPLALTRFEVVLDLSLPTPTAFSPTTVTVTLIPEAGPTADFTGFVDITADTGATCRVAVPAGTDEVSCSLTWTAVGAHSYWATYEGDAVYAAAPRTDRNVTVERGISNLGWSVDPAGSAVVGETVSVLWHAPRAGAGGTVSVWGDGIAWCTDVPVATGRCEGAFGAASATGADVDIHVRYSGDDTWGADERDLPITVMNCAVLDVRSTASTLGTVSVDTPPTCGGTGYTIGTSVTVTAHPRAGGEFLHWLGYGDAEAAGLVPVATTATTTFEVGAGSETWVRVAEFRVPCSAITASVTGSGGVFLHPASNCTTHDEKPGYLYGTAVSVYPEPAVNPRYGELDVFRSFGAVSGGTVSPDGFGRIRLALTVTGPVDVPIAFGPRCRPVTVEFAPAAAGDVSRVLTPRNCTSPTGDGYLRGTVVEVEAIAGDPHHVVTGWSVDGVGDPRLGTGTRARITVGAGDPVAVRVAHVACYALEVRIDGLRGSDVGSVGQVARDVEPNCTDGSERYLAGTAVTLTPEVLLAGAVFSGWNADPRSDSRPPDGDTGPVPAAARTVTVTADTTMVAGFYFGVACSRLAVYGDVDLVAISSPAHSDTGGGCGNGYYFDELKYRIFEDGADQVRDSWRTTLVLDFAAGGTLPTYVSIRGDVDRCFGRSLDTQTGDWTAFGIGEGAVTCDVTGPIAVQVEACQAVVPNPLIHVVGEPEGVRHGWTVPQTMFLPDDTGRIIGIDTGEFRFVEPLAVVEAGGTLVYDDLPSGACADNGVVPPDTDIALLAMGPAGFDFQGWAEPDPDRTQLNPDLRTTTTDSPTMTASPLYEVTCHTVTLDAGITLYGEPPRCPGTGPDDNSFVAGTALQVRAQQSYNGRAINTFISGVVANQVYEDPATLDLIAYAYVDRDLHVQADYPSSQERVGRGIAQGLKVTSGLFAIAAPIVLGAAFPPAGILFSVMGAGAGLASLAGQDDIAAMFDLVNPTKITACAARWAFSTIDDPTGGYNVGSIVSTSNRILKVLRGQPVVNPDAAPTGMLGGGMASFLVGLYTAQVWNADFTPQTIEQLRGTETMTGCLDEQWRFVDADL